jgi:hypothetical protein
MNRSDKWFKKYYEKESGQKISEAEFYDMKQNLVNFAQILIRWNNARPQRDLNPELFETQLVDE